MTLQSARPLNAHETAPLRWQRAQIAERIAYALSDTPIEFLALRAALGPTYDYGELEKSDRARDEIDEVEKDLQR